VLPLSAALACLHLHQLDMHHLLCSGPLPGACLPNAEPLTSVHFVGNFVLPKCFDDDSTSSPLQPHANETLNNH